MRFVNVLLAICLSQANVANAQDSDLKKIIAIQQATLESLKQIARQGGFAVGSVQQSFLTEEQFQKLMGKSWVLCNGQDISSLAPNSKWIVTTGTSKVPDCRDKFLRNQGPSSAKLGETQDDATAINNLQVSSSSSITSPLSVSVNGSLSGRLEVAGHGSFSGKSVSWGDNGSTPGLSFATSGTKDSRGVHEIYPIVSGTLTGSTSGGQISTSSTVTSKDAETRPVNITVNAFIRID